MKLFIKNMVCSRCIAAISGSIEKTGLKLKTITLGEVEIDGDISAEKLSQLKVDFHALGFEIIDNRKTRIIEQIKTTITELVQGDEMPENMNLSTLLSQKLNYEYNYISNLFSEVEGITIEKYMIAHKIERVKELLMYDELTLSQIADKLGYSSIAYLSNQFKKETGLTPSFYKSLRSKSRKKLDEL